MCFIIVFWMWVVVRLCWSMACDCPICRYLVMLPFLGRSSCRSRRCTCLWAWSRFRWECHPTLGACRWKSMPRIVTRRLGTWTLARFGGNFADLAAPSGKVVKVAGNLGGPPRLEGGVLPNRFFFVFFSFFFRFFPRKKQKKKQKKSDFWPRLLPGSPQPGPGVGSARGLEPPAQVPG
jgi:hypothetical protein